MVKIYYNLIIKKLKTIEEVPTTIREDVLKILNENGYDGYGDLL